MMLKRWEKKKITFSANPKIGNLHTEMLLQKCIIHKNVKKQTNKKYPTLNRRKMKEKFYFYFLKTFFFLENLSGEQPKHFQKLIWAKK